ncbi:dipeptidase [Cytobacillus sp. IB215316]|uniref:dipeptidase n=1 Tax=Cytobacillus sp. IB215316 TaxID=3097354 RepID=UPI002A124E38|nr:dipeptidase [Cytobacillus sp. IB215316]MDX8362172.1 dipeptidase [Cytobacillus sp. IB215316]
MNIFDAHCDVLLKMWLNPSILFENDKSLHITYEQMIATKSKIQCFAIYIPESVSNIDKFDVALEMIDIFYNQIIAKYDHIKLVKTKKDINTLNRNDIGAMLTLEGCDCIGWSITRLKTLLQLGVSSVGLTWNYGNTVADGILEERGAGLSSFGKEVVRTLNDQKVWTDVSHLSEHGFWDVMALADYPIASHSNCYKLCDHPRNLHNNQIKAMIEKDGMIGVTFVPQFLSVHGHAGIADILLHIEHLCSLGGAKNIGFGSDFDGISTTVRGMGNFKCYMYLIEELHKYYSDELVRSFLYQNFVEHLPE